MTRKPTLGERVLLAVAIAAFVAWCLVVVVIALGFLGPSMAATWAERLGLLAAGVFITVALVRLGVRSWHRAIARPLPPGRSNRWLTRQPGWRLAVGCWVLYEGPELGTSLWLSHHDHQAVATIPRLAGLMSSVAGACLVALLCRVLWRRQAENCPPGAS